MAALAFGLACSLLFNLLTLRWALREHSARRQWEQEALALQRALLFRGQQVLHRPGLQLRLALLLAGALLAAVYLLLGGQ